MYRWRNLTDEQRREELAQRIKNGVAWHRPAHYESDSTNRYLITAACYEHQPHIGNNETRIRQFQNDLLAAIRDGAAEAHAWCILPNHYHALVLAPEIKFLLASLGTLHGRTSHQWNGEENTRGRKVWHGVTERAMRGERHYFVTLNYVHHNAVKHGLVERWDDWEFTSAHEYLAKVGRDEAKRLWRDYPILQYGEKWDQ